MGWRGVIQIPISVVVSKSPLQELIVMAYCKTDRKPHIIVGKTGNVKQRPDAHRQNCNRDKILSSIRLWGLEMTSNEDSL